MLGNLPFELRAASASGKCVTPGINLWVQCPERLPALQIYPGRSRTRRRIVRGSHVQYAAVCLYPPCRCKSTQTYEFI
jgi:hypothetical protein